MKSRAEDRGKGCNGDDIASRAASRGSKTGGMAGGDVELDAQSTVPWQTLAKRMRNFICWISSNDRLTRGF